MICKWLISFLVLTTTSLSYAEELEYHPSAVTYQLLGGRFGDNLVSYLHGKWISYKYNVPLFYNPFPHADKLHLHNVEKKMTNQVFREKVKFKNLIDLDRLLNPQDSVLMIVPYFTESPIEYKMHNKNMPHFDVDWKDKGFLKLIRSLIKPKVELKKLTLPENIITVALHVRRGSGKDGPGAPRKWPHKFPPDSFYIEQLRTIDRMFDHQPLYVYIFTDYKHPEVLAQNYAEALNLPNIKFDYSTEVDTSGIGVLEDFFNLTLFDCMIRADSHFAIVATKLKDFKLVISPKSHHWKGNELFIDEVTIETSEQ